MRFSHPKHPSARQAFTLTEMLIVVGIIVLIVTLAVPAMNAITGNRSIDAAQNQLAAIIGRARQEAVGLQDYRGVLLFQDPNADRCCAVEVYFPTPGQPTLDMAPAHDDLLLPAGISFRTVEVAGGYTPMNLIMFNNRGEFVSVPWSIVSTPVSPLTTSSAQGTTLGIRIRTGLPSGQSGLGNLPNIPAAMPQISFSGNSAFGFILFPDEGAYQNAYTDSASTTYLTDNGITFLINKYNGTLLRSE
jgi:prepilin-type N-terminal cleavage/methylation domain-containing protein